MKVDFYELFSLHTPEEISGEGAENYFTAAVKSRVNEKLSPKSLAASSKIKHKRNFGKIILAAAAAVVVLVSGTLAASALGIIDLEKIFRGIFTNGFEHLESNVAVPQNVVTTGDDRLSMRVLAIGGTESEAFGTIEIKRNDGGIFPEYVGADFMHIDTEIPCLIWTEHFPGTDLLDVVDENTAIYSFRISTYYGDSLIGTELKFEISDIVDVDVIEHEVFDKEVILEGDWSISFPLEYNADYRKVSVNKTVSDLDSLITEIGYSSTCLDLYFLSGHIVTDGNYQIIIKLDNGEEYRPSGSTSYYDPDEKRDPSVHYVFDTPIDIDRIESIMINELVIPVK